MKETHGGRYVVKKLSSVERERRATRRRKIGRTNLERLKV